MDKLREQGLEDNTIIYFSTDQAAHVEEVAQGSKQRHGGHNLFRGGKGMGGFEGGIRVPALISYPDRGWTGGKLLEPSTSMMDVYPTILSLAGIETSKYSLTVQNETNHIDGRDMSTQLDALVNGAQVFTEHEFMFHYCGDKLNAIRWSLPTGDVYKLHYFQPVWDAGTEGCASMLICACYGPYINVYDVPLLYNLKTDPMEKSPLDATHSGYKEIVMKMEIGYENWRNRTEIDKSPPSMFTDWNVGVPRPWLQPLCDKFPYIAC